MIQPRDVVLPSSMTWTPFIFYTAALRSRHLPRVIDRADTVPVLSFPTVSAVTFPEMARVNMLGVCTGLLSRLEDHLFCAARKGQGISGDGQA